MSYFKGFQWVSWKKAATSSATVSHHGVTIITAGCHLMESFFVEVWWDWWFHRWWGRCRRNGYRRGRCCYKRKYCSEVVIQGKVKGRLEVELELNYFNGWIYRCWLRQVFMWGWGALNGNDNHYTKPDRKTLGKRKGKNTKKQASLMKEMSQTRAQNWNCGNRSNEVSK